MASLWLPGQAFDNIIRQQPVCFLQGFGMLIAATNLQEYFWEALCLASKKTSVQITEAAKAYLIYLLCDFTRSEKVYAGVDAGEKPSFVALLSRVQSVESEEALRIFKHLGDTSLYLLGFFRDTVERQLVDASYYKGIGESAYYSAAHLARDHTLSAAALYTELSERFADLAHLIYIMRLHGTKADKTTSLLAPSDLLTLVQRYQKTHSPELLKLLKEQGVDSDFLPLKEPNTNKTIKNIN